MNGNGLPRKYMRKVWSDMYMLLVNVAALAVGTAVGCLLKAYIPKKLQENSMMYFSIITLVLGIRLLNRTVNFSAVVIAILAGGVIGYFLGLDRRVAGLPERFASKGSGFDAGTFLTGFTLYCFSTSGILGAMDLGFSGDSTLLVTKAVMDLLAAVFFAAAGAGWQQMLITIPLGVILSGLYALSTFLMPYVTPEMIGDFSGCGGMILVANALRMTKLKNPPVIDLIPAMILVFPISWLWMMFF